MKRLLAILGILGLIGLGFYSGFRLSKLGHFDTHTIESKNVLLKEVKDVMKLITVEGYFSEVYDYKDYWLTDWRPFTKKALIRVKAKVSIGYDLEDIVFEADDSAKVIYITGLPKPEILSIDHDLDYYDLQEGSFNSFKAEDYNKLNARAKAFIETQVYEGELFESAQQQILDVQKVVRALADAQGWSVEFQNSSISG